MAGDGSGKGHQEERSKTAQRAADIAEHLEKQAEQQQEEEGK